MADIPAHLSTASTECHCIERGSGAGVTVTAGFTAAGRHEREAVLAVGSSASPEVAGVSPVLPEFASTYATVATPAVVRGRSPLAGPHRSRP